MASDVFTWAGRVAAGGVAVLGTLRLVRSVEACRSGDDIWVRGSRLKRADEEAVRRIPWEAFYELLEGAQLRRLGRLLPEGTLPQGSWTSLADFLRVRMPVPTPSGHSPEGVPIQLRPAAAPGEPNLLETSMQAWVSYVQTAPEIRLQHLVFAVNEKETESVLIRGLPLPPLPGTRFVESECLAAPAGYRWWPAVSPETIRKAFSSDQNDLVVLRPDGTASVIPRSAWISAARSTVRLMLSPENYVR